MLMRKRLNVIPVRVHDDLVKDILKCGYAEKQAPETEQLSRNQQNDEYGKEVNLHDRTHDLGIQKIGLHQVNADDEQHQFQNEDKTACLQPQDTNGQARKEEAQNRYETADKNDQREKKGRGDIEKDKPEKCEERITHGDQTLGLKRSADALAEPDDVRDDFFVEPGEPAVFKAGKTGFKGRQLQNNDEAEQDRDEQVTDPFDQKQYDQGNLLEDSGGTLDDPTLEVFGHFIQSRLVFGRCFQFSETLISKYLFHEVFCVVEQGGLCRYLLGSRFCRWASNFYNMASVRGFQGVMKWHSFISLPFVPHKSNCSFSREIL